jgi:valyl-tRNA synthetase
LDVIKEYGADALRFTITYIAPLGQDVLFSTEKCEIGRNFANKIWNAARFLLMNAEEIETDENLKDKFVDSADRWIVSRFHRTVEKFESALDNFDITGAAKIVYAYIWNDFCDWYLELIKTRLYSDDKEVRSAVLTRALSLFEEMLKLIHPFMPFLSEELWHALAKRAEGESISVSEFPKANPDLIDEAAEGRIELVKSIVTALRNIRGEMNIPPSQKINAIVTISDLTDLQKGYIKSLAKLENLEAVESAQKPHGSASAVIPNGEIYVPLEGIIDLEVEKKRLEKEIARLEGLVNGVNKKLANENFVKRAPAEVVERERMKLKDWQTALERIKALRNDLE